MSRLARLQSRSRSSFLTATARSRLSWTRWRRSRREALLRREQRRLATLTRLTQEQLERVQQVEARLHPPRLVTVEPAQTLEELHSREHPWLTSSPVGPVPTPRQVAELMQPPPEEEPLEPMPDPTQELAQRLGLPLPQR